MKTAHLVAVWVTAPVLATVLIGWGALTVSAQSRQPGELSRIVFAVK
jgi:hypothetical protein